jgi:hypothetical protein
MNFNILDDDVIQYIISKSSVLSILKLYTVNKYLITEERLNELIDNRWKINIGRRISKSVLPVDYLDFYRDTEILYVPCKFIVHKPLNESNILATNHAVMFKYNNIVNQNVALDDLLWCYDNIYAINNSSLSRYINVGNKDIQVFKGLIGAECFDLNILQYINIYNIYEIFKSSTFGRLSIFQKKYKNNILDIFTITLLSKLTLNRDSIIRNYLLLLMNILDNCQDYRYYRFKIYIAVQICKFIKMVKPKLDKHHNLKKETLKKLKKFMEEYYNHSINNWDNVPEYLYFYSVTELRFALESFK